MISIIPIVVGARIAIVRGMAAASGTERGLRALWIFVTLIACGARDRQPGSGAEGDTTGGTSSAGESATGGAAGIATGGEATGGVGGTATGGVATGGAAAGGATGGSAGDALEPVRVIRGDPAATFADLTIRGEGLDASEGKRVLVRLGWPDRPPERLGSGEARVEGGAFELFFPAVWEKYLYKTKLVLIDLDDDGVCDPAKDLMFGDSRADPVDTLVASRNSSVPDRMFETTDSFYCHWYNEPWPEE
jgi:hypothetical protein